MGLRRWLRQTRVWCNVRRARLIDVALGLDEVVLFVKRLDKESTQAVLRHFGAHIGQNCDIESGLTVHWARGDFANLTIEDDCHLGKDVFLDLTAPLVVRASSTISMRSMILTHFDPGHARENHDGYEAYASGVEIGPGAYLGAGVIVLPGTRVGSGSIVGAGAVVNRDVPPYTLVAGVPARVVRELHAEEG